MIIYENGRWRWPRLREIFCTRNVLLVGLGFWLHVLWLNTVPRDACQVCTRMRSGWKLSIKTMDSSAEFGLAPGSLATSIRYCRDSPTCSAAANRYTSLRKYLETGGLDGTLDSSTPDAGP